MCLGHMRKPVDVALHGNTRTPTIQLQKSSQQLSQSQAPLSRNPISLRVEGGDKDVHDARALGLGWVGGTINTRIQQGVMRSLP